jgi:uncharacterized protein YqgQ
MKSDNLNLYDVVLAKKSSNIINYNNRTVQNLYGNVIEYIGAGSGNIFPGWDVGKVIENDYGYRSPAFSNNVDYLFSGCSVTYGVGLPIEYVWHEQLIKSLGGTYASVAMHGDSVVGQILKIFAYIKQFGHPKNIVALFPDFNRFLVFNNPNLLAAEQFFTNTNSKLFNWAFVDNKDAQTNNYINFASKMNANTSNNHHDTVYFKKPLVADEVMTEELSHFYASQLINILEMYCNASGINLVYSTWDLKSELVFEDIQEHSLFNNYISVNVKEWEDADGTLKTLPCHNELKIDAHFDTAMDRGNGIEHAHFGLHRHIHYYETFLNYIKENWVDINKN